MRTAHPYEGKATPKRVPYAPGLITATIDTPSRRHKLSGPHPVSAACARHIAECQPGGAVIVWRTNEHDFATVYSRVSAAR